MNATLNTLTPEEFAAAKDAAFDAVFDIEDYMNDLQKTYKKIPGRHTRRCAEVLGLIEYNRPKLEAAKARWAAIQAEERRRHAEIQAREAQAGDVVTVIFAEKERGFAIPQPPTFITVNDNHIVHNAAELPGLTFTQGDLQTLVNDLTACCDDILEPRRDALENYEAVCAAFVEGRAALHQLKFEGDPAALATLLNRVAYFSRTDAFSKQPLVIGDRVFVAE